MPRTQHSTRDDIEHYVRLRTASGLGRASFGLLLTLILLTAGAWVLTYQYASTLHEPIGVAVRGGSMTDMAGVTGMAVSGMTAAHWSLAGVGTFVLVWTIMMAAMMLPSAAPMIAIFAISQARNERNTAIPTWIFVAGYILVWAAAGVLVYVIVQAISDAATDMLPEERARWAPLALGATLFTAGVYQFTPFKRVCLKHCRSPFGFVLRHWRDGALGALRMGIQHGGYCVGCCWALFAVLTAAGVMSLSWMLLLTLFIFVEKALPQSQVSTRIIGFMFVGLGIGVGAGVMAMPWVN